MAKNSQFIYSWGSGVDVTKSGVYTISSPAATAAFPSGASGAVPSGFTELGWLDADQGIVEGHSMDNTVKRAWQGGSQVKTIKSNEVRTFQFSAMEENATVMGLLRPGSTPVTTAGVTTTIVEAGTQGDVRQWVIDLAYSDSVYKRLLINQGEVTAFADVSYKYDDITVYQFTVSCYYDAVNGFYTELSVAPGVAVS